MENFLDKLVYLTLKWTVILGISFLVIVAIVASFKAGSERLEKRKSIEKIEQSIDTTTQQKVVY